MSGEFSTRLALSASLLAASFATSCAAHETKDPVDVLTGTQTTQGQTPAAPAETPTTEPTPAAVCAPPSAESLRAVRHLIKKGGMPEDDYHDLGKRQRRQDKAAQALGLHTVNTEDDVNKLYGDEYTVDKIPFDDIMDSLQANGKKLGVKIALGKPNDPGYDHGARAPKKKLLKTDEAKTVALNILEALDELPEEAFEMGGVNKITFMTGAKMRKKDDEPRIGIGGYPVDFDDTDGSGANKSGVTIYLNLMGSNAGTLKHEMKHTIDGRALCDRNSYGDEAYEALNGDTTVYRDITYDSKPLSYDGYQSGKSGNRIDKMYDAEYKGNTAKYCRLAEHDRRTRKKVMVWSDYHPNVGEDKAEIGEAILSPDSYDILLDPGMPVIVKKAEMEIARMHGIDPKLVEFLLKTGLRYKPPAISKKC